MKQEKDWKIVTGFQGFQALGHLQYKSPQLPVTVPAVQAANMSRSMLLSQKFVYLILGEPSKIFFGQTWDFVPTGLTPPPLPERWDKKNKKKILMFIFHFRLF